MQLVKISETVWIHPAAVIAVSQADDGRVWVETTDTGTEDAGESFKGNAKKLVDLIDVELRRDAEDLQLRVRRAAEVVVQAIQDHGNDLASVVAEEIRGAGEATALLGPALVTAIGRAAVRKEGG